MGNATCAICSRPRDEATMQIIELSEADKQVVRRMGENHPESKYAYCRACIKLLSNPETAIPLMKGVAQLQARRLGANPEVADQHAEAFAKNLRTKTR
jgi:hypothetical protein